MSLAFDQVYIFLKCARIRPGLILYFRRYPEEGDKVSKEIEAWNRLEPRERLGYYA